MPQARSERSTANRLPSYKTLSFHRSLAIALSLLGGGSVVSIQGPDQSVFFGKVLKGWGDLVAGKGEEAVVEAGVMTAAGGNPTAGVEKHILGEVANPHPLLRDQMRTIRLSIGAVLALALIELCEPAGQKAIPHRGQ